jgi:hypothetical protein
MTLQFACAFGGVAECIEKVGKFVFYAAIVGMVGFAMYKGLGGSSAASAVIPMKVS